jgi:hypothetical protein
METRQKLLNILLDVDYHLPALWTIESKKDSETIDIRLTVGTIREIKKAILKLT